LAQKKADALRHRRKSDSYVQEESEMNKLFISGAQCGGFNTARDNHETGT
jgi:hypothetical protein